MIVDGRTIAKEVLDEVATEVGQLAAVPKLAIITCTPNFETQKYLALKKRRAAAVGISTTVIELLEDCTTEGAVNTIKTAADQADGIIVQLPLPAHIDTDTVLAAIPYSRDIDGIHYDGTSEVLPPVIGAVAEIAKRYDVTFTSQKVTVIGAGRLVGAPALLWANEQGSDVTIVTQDTLPDDVAQAMGEADILISGAGAPGLITPDKIKDRVVIFDAGTSEDGGTLVGDADPACADKSSVFTPVPGGIGPITVACLLKNVVTLMRQ